MSGRATISVAIIAQNEAKNLAALLPLLEWADEVLVVDGGSRDDSISVARRHGGRVLRRTFDCYAAQRNFALDQARGDWVFMIDADERPSRRLASELRCRIERDKYSAYRVPIRSRIFGRAMRYGGTQDDRPIRLVRRGCARWHGAVHEQCHVQGRVSVLHRWLEHETLPDVESFLTKMRRYTRLEAAERVARGCAPRPVDAWLRPPRELFRRLVWKLGLLDGPQGWAFCALSALSAGVLAHEHRILWESPRICDRTCDKTDAAPRRAVAVCSTLTAAGVP